MSSAAVRDRSSLAHIDIARSSSTVPSGQPLQTALEFLPSRRTARCSSPLRPQAAADGATAEANQQVSKLGTLGSAFGHSMIGGFGHKKKAADAQPAPSQPTAQAPPDPVLMELTTKKSNFSTDPVPSSVFEIPAGYTQIALPQQGASPAAN